jgi:hypothetical protein
MMPSNASSPDANTSAPPSRSSVSTVVEWFTLRESVSKLPEERRNALARRLRRARQDRDNAAMMRSHGSTAEAIRLCAAALEAYRGLIDDLADSPGAEGVCARARRVLEDAGLERTASSTSPELDADVSATQIEALETTLDAEFAIDRALVPLLRSAADVRRLRAVRIGAVLLVLVVFLVRTFTPSPIRPAASGVYSPSFPATHMLDGDLETEWLAPDDTPGWIGFTFSARSVSRMRIMNAHNGRYLDRGAKDMIVQALYRKKVVFETKAVFERVSVSPDWRTIELGGVRCDEIHVELPTFHGLGPGIAEVTIE